ncbi:uncharacterized protein LOC119448087 isoform X2 [Dermacentor silvarum]|uniref:uncharacterized protein LOC119448087 isoform X2 n=1 Tax=Dermacentor silvarum TaxID=543639 RepID=UPI002100D029|nr:uncharacterized protein LOC119448087 isoform X2 [Dermacentor silvarum]
MFNRRSIIYATLLLCALLTDVAPMLRSLRAKHVRVFNGRCVYRGRSVWEAYITLADGKCVKAKCKPKERLLHFIPMKECMLPAAGRGCFYEDGLLEQQCCKPSIICY